MSTFPLLTARWQGSLSAEESADLAAHVAGLARAGLPLEGGLRALAAEIPSARLARMLRQLADRLTAGVTLEAAIQAVGRRLPADLRGLIVAGIRSGRLAIVLGEFAALVRHQQQLRRRATLAVAYPTLLLGAMSLLMAHICGHLAPQYRWIYRDFGMRLPGITEFFLTVSGPLAAGMLAATVFLAALPVLISLAPRSVCLSWFFTRVPVIGPILRFGALAQFSELTAMLVEQEVPLPESLRLTAAGLCDASLARVCRRAATAVETGAAIDEVLAANRRFPPSMIALVQWGQRTGNLADAFRGSAEMFEARARSQSVFLEVVLPPLAFLGITAMVGFSVVALMSPLVSLITCLSGGGK